MPHASVPLAHGSGGAFVHDGRGFRRYALLTTGAAVAALIPAAQKVDTFLGRFVSHGRNASRFASFAYTPRCLRAALGAALFLPRTFPAPCGLGDRFGGRSRGPYTGRSKESLIRAVGIIPSTRLPCARN